MRLTSHETWRQPLALIVQISRMHAANPAVESLEMDYAQNHDSEILARPGDKTCPKCGQTNEKLGWFSWPNERQPCSVFVTKYFPLDGIHS